MPNAVNWHLVMAFAVACIFCSGCAKQSEWKKQYILGLNELVSHNYLGAETNLKKAVSLAEKEQEDHLALAETLTALGRVYAEQGKFASAEVQFRRAEQEYETAFDGDQNPRVAAALNELAACHHKQADYDKAEVNCQRALAIRKNVLAPDDLLIASTYTNLAEICQKRQKDAEAEQNFEKALTIYRSSKKPQAAKGLVQALNSLALFYSRNQDLERAHQAVDQALAVEKTHPDLGAADVAATILARASMERASFEHDKAEQDFLHAISLLSSDKVPHHEQLCEALDNYADLLLDQHRFEKGEPIYKEAIEHCRHAHGNAHPCVAERMDDLAKMYRQDGRLKEAEALLKEAVEINRQCFDSDSPILVSTINELSKVYLDDHKYKQAEQVYEEWVPSMERILGPTHPHVIDALENWAMIAAKANDKAQAKRLSARAKELRESIHAQARKS